MYSRRQMSIAVIIMISCEHSLGSLQWMYFFFSACLLTSLAIVLGLGNNVVGSFSGY